MIDLGPWDLSTQNKMVDDYLALNNPKDAKGVYLILGPFDDNVLAVYDNFTLANLALNNFSPSCYLEYWELNNHSTQGIAVKLLNTLGRL